MILRPYPDFDRLRQELDSLRSQAQPWKGLVYRFVEPAWAGPADLVSGMGAKQAGARWNPPDVCCVVYGALNPEAPLKETMAYCSRFNLPLARNLPRQLAAIQVELDLVLNLTDAAVLRALQVT